MIYPQIPTFRTIEETHKNPILSRANVNDTSFLPFYSRCPPFVMRAPAVSSRMSGFRGPKRYLGFCPHGQGLELRGRLRLRDWLAGWLVVRPVLRFSFSRFLERRSKWLVSKLKSGISITELDLELDKGGRVSVRYLFPGRQDPVVPSIWSKRQGVKAHFPQPNR